MKYLHLIEYVSESAWAILPSKLAEIVAVLATRAADEEVDPQIVAAVVAARRQAEPPRSGAAVAVLPLFGTIGHRAGSMRESSGGVSTERWGAAFRQAIADPNVSAIVVDVDSPGGVVAGTPELAEEVYRARGRKPLVAVANSLAASAAYWLASQADELVSIPSGQVGSIGVMTGHVDMSAALEQKGVRVTYLTSARFKAEGAPEAPLSVEAAAHYQSQIDHYHSLFVRAVARGRGVPVAAVRGEQFGEGRVYNANEAQRRGMIDRVATLEQVVGELAAGRWQRPERAAVTDLDFVASTGDESQAADVPPAIEMRVSTDRLRRRLRLVLDRAPAAGVT